MDERSRIPINSCSWGRVIRSGGAREQKYRDFQGKALVSGPRGAAARGTAPYAMALFAAYADVLGPSFQSVAVSHESVFNQLVGHMNQCSISWPVT